PLRCLIRRLRRYERTVSIRAPAHVLVACNADCTHPARASNRYVTAGSHCHAETATGAPRLELARGEDELDEYADRRRRVSPSTLPVTWHPQDRPYREAVWPTAN